MAKAVNSTIVPVSQLIRDPLVRSAFERAERDNGSAFAIVVIEPVLSGDAAAEMEAV